MCLRSVVYLCTVGFCAGGLIALSLMALILSHRRPRNFERLLFLVLLSLFFFYSGGLLVLDAHIHYPVRPKATLGLHGQSLQEKLRELGIQCPGK